MPSPRRAHVSLMISDARHALRTHTASGDKSRGYILYLILSGYKDLIPLRDQDPGKYIAFSLNRKCYYFICSRTRLFDNIKLNIDALNSLK